MNLIVGGVATLAAVSATTTAAIVLATAVRHHRGVESTFARQARLDRESESERTSEPEREAPSLRCG